MGVKCIFIFLLLSWWRSPLYIDYKFMSSESQSISGNTWLIKKTFKLNYRVFRYYWLTTYKRTQWLFIRNVFIYLCSTIFKTLRFYDTFINCFKILMMNKNIIWTTIQFNSSRKIILYLRKSFKSITNHY